MLRLIFFVLKPKGAGWKLVVTAVCDAKVLEASDPIVMSILRVGDERGSDE